MIRLLNIKDYKNLIYKGSTMVQNGKFNFSFYDFPAISPIPSSRQNDFICG